MTWDRVRAWRDELRDADLSEVDTGLSLSGTRLALTLALDALDDASLAAVESTAGEPLDSAAIAVPRSVCTAAIEWSAVLLGRGTKVTIKHPTGHPGLTPLLCRAAQRVSLPLFATSDRGALGGQELLIGMGRDETITALDAQSSGKFLGFGHRYSIAWTEHGGWDAIAADAAVHDGRGCMSPTVVLTPLPLAEASNKLAEALARAQEKWPVGARGEGELAAIRSRRALARAVGHAIDGAAFSVHALPERFFEPLPLPRSIAIIRTEDPAAVLRPFAPQLSTVGTDSPLSWPSTARVCRLGQMQRPPLLRLHDGVDWIAATRR